MSEQSLSYVLEAVLLAAGRPVSVDQMLELFEESQRPSVEEVNAALEELAGRCADRACELREVASGWRMQVRAQDRRHHQVVGLEQRRHREQRQVLRAERGHLAPAEVVTLLSQLASVLDRAQSSASRR